MNESKVLGKFARLYVSKITKFGVMLRSFEEKDLEVLLPNNQVKKGTEKGDFYEVFLYKDSEDRLIATHKDRIFHSVNCGFGSQRRNRHWCFLRLGTCQRFAASF